MPWLTPAFPFAMRFINRGWDETATWLDKAQEAAIKALAIDQSLPEAHFALGFYYEMKEDWDQEGAMRRVLLLDPNHAHAHDSLGDVYYQRDQLEEAISEYQTALTLILPPQGAHPTRRHLRKSRSLSRGNGPAATNFEISPTSIGHGSASEISIVPREIMRKPCKHTSGPSRWIAPMSIPGWGSA